MTRNPVLTTLAFLAGVLPWPAVAGLQVSGPEPGSARSFAAPKTPARAQAFQVNAVQVPRADSQTCRVADYTVGLTGPCFPRCTTATVERADACADDHGCLARAYERDTTPTIAYDEFGETHTLDCTTCIDLQAYSCELSVCPVQAAAADACYASLTNPDDYADACEAEDDALYVCLFETRRGPYIECSNRQTSRCAGGGAS